jgi:bifunctional UDP-N-acetylglucosamine pyrophosphorylase / glucosamine-1-phosphate N-acetyltransferase
LNFELQQPDRPLDAIILAAGQGVRMGGDRAKVLFLVAGRAMIHWVLDACQVVGTRRNVIVIGHQAQAVRDELAGRPNCVFVEQTQRLGTGHAVQQAAPLFLDPEPPTPNRDRDVLVLCGDGPLIRPQTLRKLIDTHRSRDAAATLATSVIDDATGYGRIIRDNAGQFQKIIEHKDADESQRRVREVNPSYYCFKAGELFAALAQVTNENAKGEYYITDVFEILLRAGRTVAVVDAVPPEDVLSINTPAELAVVDGILRRRLGLNSALRAPQSASSGAAR